MPLTPAAMAALFNDNTSGDISAADGRAVIQALYDWSSNGVPSAGTTIWDGSTLATGTTLTVSGSQTIVESNGLLSVKFTGQSAADMNAWLVADALSVGEMVCCRVDMIAPSAAYSMAGVVISDGVTATSAAQSYIAQRNGGTLTYVNWAGTFTNMAAGAEISLDYLGRIQSDRFWFGLEYDAANSFKLWYGDGVQWIDMEIAAQAETITPTHIGIVWTTWGGSHDAVATFGPLRVVTP